MAAKAITVASPWGSVHATLVAATQDVDGTRTKGKI